MAVVDSTRTVTEILDRVLAGERLSDADALTLMQSRDLVSIGAAANEIRNRKANPGEVTYIVDRNINYTNVCVTDCNFCAFYRKPGDTREGYVLPKRIIFAKIEEIIINLLHVAWLSVRSQTHNLVLTCACLNKHWLF